MVRILHLADLHLGWEPRFLGPRAAERQRERDSLMEGVVDFATAPGSGIGMVIIVGDLFDNHTPPPALVDQVVRQLRRLLQHSIQVITVPGNHDEITYPDSVYRLRAADWPGVLVQNPQPQHVVTMDIQGEPCHLYALAYTGGLTRTRPPIDDLPHNGQAGWHIAAFHGSLDWDAGDRSLPLSGAALDGAGYDYVALGHLHKPSQRQLARGVAVYPGSIADKGWEDPGSGRLTVTTLTNQGVQVERIPFTHQACRSCRIWQVDAGLYHSYEEMLAALKAGIEPEAMLSIQLAGTANFPFQAAQVESQLAGSCYHLEVVNRTNALDLHMLEAWARENTLRGLFVQKMQQRLAEASTEEERRLVTRALMNGLAALTGVGNSEPSDRMG